MHPRPPPSSSTTTTTAEADVALPLHHYHHHHYSSHDSTPRLQSLSSDRPVKPALARGRDSVISHPLSPHPSFPPSPRSSTDSAGRRHRSISEIQHSPRPTNSHSRSHSLAYPPQAYLDPEKHAHAHTHAHTHPHHPASPQFRHSHRASTAHDTVIYDDQGEYLEKGPDEKAWQLLFFLSGPCAFLSLVIALWTVAALVISLVLAPIRLCCSRPPFATHLSSLLAPALNLQLHLIYSYNASTNYSLPMLVVVHLFSPLVALGVAIASWTAAAFCIFTSILGDPGGNDGHNDGKDSILGVRAWWETWLSRCLREERAT